MFVEYNKVSQNEMDSNNMYTTQEPCRFCGKLLTIEWTYGTIRGKPDKFPRGKGEFCTCEQSIQHRKDATSFLRKLQA